jgi:hypothetical protein
LPQQQQQQTDPHPSSSWQGLGRRDDVQGQLQQPRRQQQQQVPRRFLSGGSSSSSSSSSRPLDRTPRSGHGSSRGPPPSASGARSSDAYGADVTCAEPGSSSSSSSSSSSGANLWGGTPGVWQPSDTWAALADSWAAAEYADALHTRAPPLYLPPPYLEPHTSSSSSSSSRDRHGDRLLVTAQQHPAAAAAAPEGGSRSSAAGQPDATSPGPLSSSSSSVEQLQVLLSPQSRPTSPQQQQQQGSVLPWMPLSPAGRPDTCHQQWHHQHQQHSHVVVWGSRRHLAQTW